VHVPAELRERWGLRRARRARALLAGGADFGRLFDTVDVISRIGTFADWTQLTAGDTHACGLREGGQLLCWGNGDKRQRGPNGASTNVPEVVDLGAAVLEVAAGAEYTCAVRNDGAVWCWGFGVSGQLGRTLGATTGAPASINATGPFAHVRTGATTTCLLDDAGLARCFGTGTDGQRLDGTTISVVNPPAPDPDGVRWQALSLGTVYGCGLDDEGALLCAGNNADGPVGLGGIGNKIENRVPRVVGAAALPIALGHEHGCAGIDGVACWGRGGGGRIGDGTVQSRAAPVSVAPGAWRSLAAGNAFSCGVDDGGDLYCWGTNNDGLGVDGVTSSTVPIAVGEPGAWAEVTAGGLVACALRADDGSAWCWGNNGSGVLAAFSGSGTPLTRAKEPVPVSGGHSFVDISTSGSHACGIDDEGAAWCWGGNAKGGIGNGTSDSAPVRTLVSAPPSDGGVVTWVDIGVGREFTCGVRSDDTLWCWGANSQGDLGNGQYGASAWRTLPVQIGEVIVWRSVSPNSTHACALNDEGRAYCWGDSEDGQIGIGLVNLPVLAPTATFTTLRFAALASGGQFFTCGVTTQSELACWGSYVYGRLADGYAFSHEVVQVPFPR
jgi:alpha-tubulin suppressor-like RCC1 family protein